MTTTSLTVIILTYNEELHLERCIRSLQSVAERIIIVDSYSTDRTLEIAQLLGAEVFQNPFVHQAQQFQWALDNVPVSSEWVMRMDADEYIFPELANELATRLSQFPPETTGLSIKRRVFFMDKWIRRGYYPMVLLRVWRNGTAYIEQKWMDEHIRLKHGRMEVLQHDMADHNLNNLTWWTAKHNAYATREAVERLNAQYHFLEKEPDETSDSKIKWHKQLYTQLPLFVRPFGYFFYRYCLRLGFLEGKPGLIWHVLQGFWFQFLVDAKIYQIKYLAKKQGKSVRQILIENFGIKLPNK
ncbi:MAG: glycosyltransferase family 2 protein [Saprospiraceae bacterium]|nr:glycosyltransferase family 2 protein [Saprospiraceae bacterium]